MKQYGDIIRLSGQMLEPVDLIVGGSPCQDLSVAGKRAGLDGERSGLFMEMIRIIKQMRKETDGLYPRFALWENVPGAFSSNNGRDFGAVLGEFARLIEPTAPDVPVPEEGWPKAGVLLVSNGSIAWRTHDAQYWGVPQRRRRIALVADFRGQSAPEILFERKGVSGNSEPGEAQGEDLAESVGGSIDSAVSTVREHIVFDSKPYHDYRQMKDVCNNITASYGTGGNNMPFVVNEREGNQRVMNLQAFGVYSEGDTASSLKQRDYKDATDLVLADTEQTMTYQALGVNSESDTGSSLKAAENVSNCDLVIKTLAVRRLTPLECERLQGYPDRWTDIPGASDSARYKALGNSIALPFWEHLAHRFAQYGMVRTIGSLFDGIGGFPLVFKRAGAETKWTSEIEPFCEQVVKYHADKGDL